MHYLHNFRLLEQRPRASVCIYTATRSYQFVVSGSQGDFRAPVLGAQGFVFFVFGKREGMIVQGADFTSLSFPRSTGSPDHLVHHTSDEATMHGQGGLDQSVSARKRPGGPSLPASAAHRARGEAEGEGGQYCTRTCSENRGFHVNWSHTSHVSSH